MASLVRSPLTPFARVFAAHNAHSTAVRIHVPVCLSRPASRCVTSVLSPPYKRRAKTAAAAAPSRKSRPQTPAGAGGATAASVADAQARLRAVLSANGPMQQEDPVSSAELAETRQLLKQYGNCIKSKDVLGASSLLLRHADRMPVKAWNALFYLLINEGESDRLREMIARFMTLAGAQQRAVQEKKVGLKIARLFHVRPDATTFKLLIGYLRNHLDLDKLQVWIDKLLALQPALDRDGFHLILWAQAKRGDLAACHVVLEKMRALGIVPSITAYALVLRAAGVTQIMTNVEAAWDEIVNKRQLKPDEEAYFQLMKAFHLCGDDVRARQVYSMVKRAELAPSPKMKALMAQFLLRSLEVQPDTAPAGSMATSGSGSQKMELSELMSHAPSTTGAMPTAAANLLRDVKAISQSK